MTEQPTSPEELAAAAEEAAKELDEQRKRAEGEASLTEGETPDITEDDVDDMLSGLPE